MQNIDAARQMNRVHGTISIASVVFNDLQDARTAKAPERLGIGVLFSTLRYVERVAKRVLNLFGKGSEVGPGAPDPNDWLDTGRRYHFHIMPKRA